MGHGYGWPFLGGGCPENRFPHWARLSGDKRSNGSIEMKLFILGKVNIFLLITVLSFTILWPSPSFAQKRMPAVHYEATPQIIVEEMLKMAEVTRNDIVYDLGCGDGRFVITAARKYGARGVGIDIDPQRILESQRNARRAGVTDKVQFKEGDLFETDIREATLVVLYLLPELNLELRPKLLKELRPGARVLSYEFDMYDWLPDRMGRWGGNKYFYWIIPTDVAGLWVWSLPLRNRMDRFSLDLSQKFQEIQGMIRTPVQEISALELYLRGDRIGFLLRYRHSEQEMEMYYRGRVMGSSMRGKVEIKTHQSVIKYDWMATRRPSP